MAVTAETQRSQKEQPQVEKAEKVKKAKKVNNAEKEQSASKVDLNQIGSKDEAVENRTVESRNVLRNKVEDDIAAFLARGGTISEIAPDVTADPPKKPENNYGSRAI